MRDDLLISCATAKRELKKIAKQLVDSDGDPDFQEGVLALEKLFNDRIAEMREASRNK